VPVRHLLCCSKYRSRTPDIARLGRRRRLHPPPSEINLSAAVGGGRSVVTTDSESVIEARILPPAGAASADGARLTGPAAATVAHGATKFAGLVLVARPGGPGARVVFGVRGRELETAPLEVGGVRAYSVGCVCARARACMRA
jgi:hypothetical protein